MNKKILIIAIAVLMLFATVSIFAGGKQEKGETTTGSLAPEKELEFIYVSHAPNINVFQTMREASEDAAKAIGNIKVTWMGPDKVGDINEQKSILEMAINKNPDAIMTTTNNPDAYDEVVNKAAAKGIPVFTYNIDNPDTDRICYVGQEFLSAGNKFAKMGIEMLKDRFPGQSRYKVAIFTGEAGNYALERRIQGTREIFDADPSIELIDVFITSWDQTEAYNLISEVFQKYPDLKGAFGMDAYSEFIGKYVHDKKKNGEVIVGGFDITDQAVQYIKEDAMQYLVGQNTYMQGWMPTILAYMYLEQGKLPPDLVDTGAPVITKDNLEDADLAS